MIYRAIAQSEAHPSPEAIYERVRKQIPSISLGTVYRNIKLFVDIGALRLVRPVNEPLRLDPNVADHHHLICRCCRAIVDIRDEEIAPIRFRRALPKGFRMERCEVEVLGICARCRGPDLKLKTKAKRRQHKGKSRQTDGGAGGR